MRTISTQELAALADELRWMEGFFVDKFYEIAKSRFRLKVSRKGEQANLQIILSHTFGKTQYVEQTDNPTPFAMAVRKRIDGYMIERVEQYNKDRIILMRLKRGTENANVIFEMFGTGNVLITDNGMKITLVYEPHEYKDRTIKIGEQYVPPKGVTAPAATAAKLSPILLYKDGKCVDYSFFGQAKEGTTERAAPSLQDALDEFYHENPIAEEKKPTKEQMAIEELESSIEKQHSLIKSAEKQIEENKVAGDRVFALMKEINEVIAYAQENKRVTKEELQKAFPKIKVLNVDLKDKTVEIEV